MTIMNRNDRPASKPKIDLSGPEGNAFVLMGYAKSYAKDLGLDGSAIIEDMMSGDYDHLLEAFDRHFGDYVILWK